MKTYDEIRAEYRKRQQDTVVDVIATGLTYLDEVAVESGLLEEAGLLTELGGSVCSALPFAVIAATEGGKVLLGLKPGSTGWRDGAFRMAKTGAALGIGAAVASAAGVVTAIPVTMGVRALFDRYRSRALTGRRVQGRIQRLREMNAALRQEQGCPYAPETVLLIAENDENRPKCKIGAISTEMQ